MRLLIATTNHGKAKEFRRIFAPTPSPGTPGRRVAAETEGRVEGLISQSSVQAEALPTASPRLSFVPQDLTDLPPVPAVEETGRTFLANACLKATYYARHFNAWTLADDSGLAVDALAGKPGVHSARWSEMHGRPKGDIHNNQLLLEQLNEVEDPQRTARFVCALALADSDGRIILTASDWVSGRILRAPAGAGGFGYDPLFFLESHARTTAELSPADKDALSHRGKAGRRMMDLLLHHRIKFTS